MNEPKEVYIDYPPIRIPDDSALLKPEPLHVFDCPSCHRRILTSRRMHFSIDPYQMEYFDQMFVPVKHYDKVRDYYEKEISRIKREADERYKRLAQERMLSVLDEIKRTRGTSVANAYAVIVEELVKRL